MTLMNKSAVTKVKKHESDDYMCCHKGHDFCTEWYLDNCLLTLSWTCISSVQIIRTAMDKYTFYNCEYV